MRQWTLGGPDQDWFTASEVAVFLGCSVRTLQRLVASGQFPRGIKPLPASSPRWSGLDIAAYLHIKSRSHDGPCEKFEDDDDDEKKA